MTQDFPYAATTRGITVRVAPSFLEDQSNPEEGRFLWAYHIRIENDGADEVQLIDRHWRIIDARGRTEEVRGEGVVGEQPIITPGEAYDYVSGCPLGTPSGLMQGSYGMVDAHGARFEVEIPAFSLDSPHQRITMN